MTIELDLQDVSGADSVPELSEFERWVEEVLREGPSVSLAIRVVDEKEMRDLNERFRGKEGATNVLSFPAELPGHLDGQLDPQPLGDIVICAAVVEAETLEQGKVASHHWAHLTVHGLLHLRGYDHQDDDQAEAMESLETEILDRLGIPDPYAG